MDSAGSASEENAKYMESLSAKISLAKASFQELVLGDGGLSDFLKMTVDTGTAILKFANSDIGQLIVKLTLAYTTINLVNKSLKTFTKFQGISILVSQFKDLTASAGLLKGSLALISSYLSPFLVGGAVIVGAYALYKNFLDTNVQLEKANETLAVTNDKIKEVSDEYDTLKSKGDNLNNAEKTRLKYLEEQLDLLKEQKKQQSANVAEKGLANYNTTIQETKTKTQAGQKFTYYVDVKVRGQEALDATISKFEELKESYDNGDVTLSDYINKQQELVNGLDEVWSGYEQLINSGEELTSEQQSNAESIARLNVELVSAGGNSNALSQSMLMTASSASDATNANGNLNNSLQEAILKFYGVASGSDEAQKYVGLYKLQAFAVQSTGSMAGIINTDANAFLNLARSTGVAVKYVQKYQQLQSQLKNLKGSSSYAAQAIKEEMGNLQQNIESDISSALSKGFSSPAVTGGGVPSSKSSKGSKSKSTADKYKQYADKMFAQLRHKYEMGEISTKTYYSRLDKLNQKYFKGRKKYLDDYNKYEEQIHDYQAKLAKENLDEKLSNLKTESGYTRKNRESFIAYLKKQRKNSKITLDEMNEYYKQYYNLRSENYVKDYEDNEKSFKKSKSLLYSYVKQGKIKWSEYHKYIDDLNKISLSKQKEQLESLQNNLDLQLDAMDWYADQQQNALDEQIKALEKEKDLLNKQNDERERAIELERLEQALAEAKNKRVKVYREGKGFVYEQDEREVGEAQSNLNKYKQEQQDKATEDRINSQIEKLQEQKDAWSKYVNDYKNLQSKLLNEQKLGTSYEKLIQDNKITNLQSFADKYKEIIEELVEAQKKLLALQAQQSETDAWNSMIKEKYKYTSYDKETGKWHGSNVSQSNANKLAGNKTSKKPTKHAKGTNVLPFSQWVNYDEQGDELIIPPEANTGKVGYMSKGTGIVPHTLSENLMEIGKYSMNGLKSILSGGNKSTETIIDKSVHINGIEVKGQDGINLYNAIQKILPNNR